VAGTRLGVRAEGPELTAQEAREALTRLDPMSAEPFLAE
jgi:hypothetical protein